MVSVVSIDFTALVGLVATVFSTGVLVPTAARMYVTKKVHGIEPLMVGQALVANALWSLYGVMAGDTYVLGRAILSGFFSTATLVMYYRYRSR
jgi:uncharacterized protein with PQ loop repeat